MISRLTGRLIEKNPPQIVIDVNGVGYEADVSMQTFYNLPALGETVQLYTQLVVREDAHLLFGFATADERATFRQLVKVSGIGAKTALGILSAMSADELARAVADEDIKRLSSAPGIGKKTAERMVLELRGKLVSHAAADGLFAAAPAADSLPASFAALPILRSATPAFFAPDSISLTSKPALIVFSAIFLLAHYRQRLTLHHAHKLKQLLPPPLLNPHQIHSRGDRLIIQRIRARHTDAPLTADR